MARLTERIVMTLLLLVVVAIILGMTLQLGKTARMVPLWVVGPTGLLLLLQLARDLLAPAAQGRREFDQRSSRSSSSLEQPVQAQKAIEAEARGKGPILTRELQIIFCLFMTAVAVYTFGFLLTAPLFILLVFKVWAKESWLVSVVSALGTLCLVSAFIWLLMPARLVDGLLWRWLGV